MSGSTIVAGAAEHKVGTNAFQGAVYEWTLPTSGAWKNSKQTAELTASDGLADGFLGISVAVSGSTIVAGALGPDGDSGYSVGVSGSTIAAGAPAHKIGSNSSQGVVHEYDSTGWKAPKITSAGSTSSRSGRPAVLRLTPMVFLSIRR